MFLPLCATRTVRSTHRNIEIQCTFCALSAQAGNRPVPPPQLRLSQPPGAYRCCLWELSRTHTRTTQMAKAKLLRESPRVCDACFASFLIQCCLSARCLFRFEGGESIQVLNFMHYQQNLASRWRRAPHTSPRVAHVVDHPTEC